jgi:SAM-dependent methyltransferase
MPEIEERDRQDRAEAFDVVARDYDDFRPGYPEQLYDEVWKAAGLRDRSLVVEVGSGTGLATAGLATRAGQVICVEPGDQLTRIAKRRLSGRPNISWITVPFQEWSPPEPADLLFAADAWHWIEPEAADRLATAALARDGCVAVVSHQARLLTGPVVAALNEAYERCSPTIACAGVRAAPDLHDRGVATLARFVPLVSRTYRMTRRLSADDYVRLLGTYSDHALLPADRRTALFDQIRAAIDTHAGGYLDKEDDVLLHLARRP